MGRRFVPVAVVHCENDPGSQWARIVEHFAGTTVECLDSMVDRVCSHISTESDSVVVFVEPYSMWAIERPRQQVLFELIDCLAAEEVVNLVVSGDLERTRKLKRLLLNGTDLCLGIAGLSARVAMIRDSPGDAGLIITDLLLASREIGSIEVDGALIEYSAALAQRLAVSLNGVSSTIQRFNLFQLDEFFHNADFKMGDEIRWLLANRPSSPALEIFDHMTRMFSRGDRLVDPPSSLKDGPPPISQLDVIKAFDAFVGGDTSPRIVETRSSLHDATSLLD